MSTLKSQEKQSNHTSQETSSKETKELPCFNFDCFVIASILLCDLICPQSLTSSFYMIYPPPFCQTRPAVKRGLNLAETLTAVSTHPENRAPVSNGGIISSQHHPLPPEIVRDPGCPPAQGPNFTAGVEDLSSKAVD